MDEASSGQTVAERRARSDPRLKLPPGPGLSAADVAAHQTARIHAALIEIVAEGGYESLKVRDLVSAASVSSRAFYERYASKEDCFLQAYELLARRATRRIVATQAEERDWRGRAKLLVEGLTRAVAREPSAARFVLVDARAAGPASQERAWRAERHLDGVVAESLARAPGGVAVPPLVVEGIVAGVAHVARSRLLAGRAAEMEEIAGELTQWALSNIGEAALALDELDGQSVWRNTMLEPLPETTAVGGGGTWPPTGDRALILAAVAKLTVADGYSSLTASRIRAAAGVSRRQFDAYFGGVEACYVAAFEARAAEALAQAARAQAAARGWAGGVYRAIAAFCERIAADAFLAGVCLKDELPPGSVGSRTRQRLAEAVAEQLGGSAPRDARPSAVVAEASAGAVWGVFHRHLIRGWVNRRHLAATLSYLALAPLVGPAEAVAAIAAEQSP